MNTTRHAYNPNPVATPEVDLTAVDYLGIDKIDDQELKEKPISLQGLLFCWRDADTLEQCEEPDPDNNRTAFCCPGIDNEAECTNGCVPIIEWTSNEVGSGERRFVECRTP